MLDNHFMIGFADELTLEKEAAHPLFSTVTRGGTMLGRKVRGMMRRAIDLGTKKPRLRKKAQDGTVAGMGTKGTTMETKPNLGAPPKPATPPPGQGQPKPMPMPSTGGNPQPMGTGRGVRKRAADETTQRAGDAIRRVLEEASPESQARMSTGDGGQVMDTGSEDPLYGCGTGKKKMVKKGGMALVNNPQYGGGLGNLGGKKAPTFTSSTKGGKVGNPTENPGRFGTGCGPKYGCGGGKHGTGCGAAKQGTGCGPKFGCGAGKHGTGCGMGKKASKMETARKAGNVLKNTLGIGAVGLGGAAAYQNRDKIKRELDIAGDTIRREVDMRRRENERRHRKDEMLNAIGL
jgi:hypothetical protein